MIDSETGIYVDAFMRTDLGNAERLVAWHGDICDTFPAGAGSSGMTAAGSARTSSLESERTRPSGASTSRPPSTPTPTFARPWALTPR